MRVRQLGGPTIGLNPFLGTSRLLGDYFPEAYRAEQPRTITCGCDSIFFPMRTGFSRDFRVQHSYVLSVRTLRTRTCELTSPATGLGYMRESPRRPTSKRSLLQMVGCKHLRGDGGRQGPRARLGCCPKQGLRARVGLHARLGLHASVGLVTNFR
jgi:hypothetical protein